LPIGLFAEVRDDTVAAQPKSISENLRRVARFAFAACENAGTPLAQGQAAIACMRARPRSFSGQSGTGTLGSIATSGWVMKKTVGTES
jgi:hypothetical protein